MKLYELFQVVKESINFNEKFKFLDYLDECLLVNRGIFLVVRRERRCGDEEFLQILVLTVHGADCGQGDCEQRLARVQPFQGGQGTEKCKFTNFRVFHCKSLVAVFRNTKIKIEKL